MLSAFFSSRRRRMQRQAAAGMAEWLEGLQRILDGCADAIAAPRPPDCGTALDTIDRALFRFNQCASEVRAPLRRSYPELADQLRHCTDLAYHLRNHTRTYLLRAADVVALEDRGHLPNSRATQALEGAQRQAAEAAVVLRREFAALAPGLRRLITEWSESE